MKTNTRFTFTFSNLALLAAGLIVLSLLVRAVSLPLYPLMDTTEARYGEMARIMFETQNWVTPMFDYDVPFWGKPPLFTWLSASGIALFGNTEFAVRMPHLLAGMGILFLVFGFATKAGKCRAEALLATAILSTSAAFIVISGAVMTDTALTLGITLSMTSFWLAMNQQSRLFGYLFFVGLAIGLLAKGPLTLVLVGISLSMWLILDQRWRRALSVLPWMGGSVLLLALTLPWYALAEFRTPGFLEYFLIGEHFMRFVVSGWQGDLYGTAHNEVRGTIWLFAILAALPWTPLFFYQLFKRFRHGTESINNAYTQYLWCWMLAPMLLFTFAGNILSSYVMPALPAFALLLSQYQSERPVSNHAYTAGFITPALILGTALLLAFGLSSKSTQNNLLAFWEKQPEARFSDLYYVGQRPFSAQYYSNGKAQLVETTLDETIEQLLRPTFVVYRARDNAHAAGAFCQHRGEFNERVLLFCQPNKAVSRN